MLLLVAESLVFSWILLAFALLGNLSVCCFLVVPHFAGMMYTRFANLVNFVWSLFMSEINGSLSHAEYDICPWLVGPDNWRVDCVFRERWACCTHRLMQLVIFMWRF